MKHKDYSGVDATDLQRQIHDSQEQLFRLRFQMGMGQLEGLTKYRGLRKDRARMLTVLRAKELAGEKIVPLARAAPVAVKAPAKRKGLGGLFKRKQRQK
jgi:large subunit ribosomal protein L29